MLKNFQNWGFLHLDVSLSQIPNSNAQLDFYEGELT